MKKRIAINGLLDWDGETKGSNRQAESKLVQFWSFDRRFGTTTLAFHDFFAKYHDMKISINVRAPRNHPCLMGFFITSHPLGYPWVPFTFANPPWLLLARVAVVLCIHQNFPGRSCREPGHDISSSPSPGDGGYLLGISHGHGKSPISIGINQKKFCK